MPHICGRCQAEGRTAVIRGDDGPEYEPVYGLCPTHELLVLDELRQALGWKMRGSVPA